MYQVLSSSLNGLGFLDIKGGGDIANFWGDTITQQIADSSASNDIISLLTRTNNNIDTIASGKSWSHTMSLNVRDVGVGAQTDVGNFLLYQDPADKVERSNKYYLMQISQAELNETLSGDHYRTITGYNAAIQDLSHKIVRAMTFSSYIDTALPAGVFVNDDGSDVDAKTQSFGGSITNVLKWIFTDTGWTVKLNDNDVYELTDYTFDGSNTAQAALQDLVKTWSLDVDAYVLLDSNGRVAKKIIYLSQELGNQSGEYLLRYGRDFANVKATATFDQLYTKLYVYGKDSATIKNANGGLTYIVDDDANDLYNPYGSSSYPVRYYEGTITSSYISEPTALLEWGKKALKALNHPRTNYEIDVVMNDKTRQISLGDRVRVQDDKASTPIYEDSRVVSKTISFADPQNNTITIGEFSPISVTKPTVSQQINTININVGDVRTTAEESITVAGKASDAADNAKTTAELAKKKADEANQNAQTASQKIDATMVAERSRVNELLDQQTTKIQGVVQEASDYTDSAKAEVLNRAQSLADEAKNGAVAQSKVDIDSITNWVKDSDGNLSASMMTALFNTTALKDFDKNSSVKSQTANMISSAVSDSENGMRSLISQKADSTVIGNISESLSNIQKSTQWQQIAYDDVNFLKSQGNYLITSGAGTNSPIKPWFYITVDVPRGDRITQHIWKDLDSSMSYSRIFDGSNWSEWIQIANSSTLLSIFNDQWSLGTYINTSIGQKIATGISGLPDGTLALTGRSIHLTGDTIIDGSFMTKALSTQDATIGKTLTLGSDGKLVSSGLSSAFNSYIIGMATGFSDIGSPYAIGIPTSNGGVTIDQNGYNYSATYDTWLQDTSSKWNEYKGTINTSLQSGSLVFTENTTSTGINGKTEINAGSSKWTWSGANVLDGYTYVDGLSLLITGTSNNPLQTYITKNTVNTSGSVYGSTVSSKGLRLDTSSALVGTTKNTILLQPYQYENAGFTFRYDSSASVNTHTIQLTGKGYTLKFVNDGNGSDDWSSDATVTAGKIASTSTRKSKVNIESISDSDIDKILSVTPRTFNRIQNLEAVKSEIEGTNESYAKADLQHMLDKEYGFVIEELQEVGLSGGLFSYDEDGNAVALSYDRITALLLSAIKRQQSEKAELELTVAKQQIQIDNILKKLGE